MLKSKIPAQETGSKSDTVSEIIFDNENDAKSHYKTVKKRFLDINSWEFFAGEEKAEFKLKNALGELLLEPPKIGNYISIKVPGLHNDTGDGFDWVIIEEFQEEEKNDEECVYLRVRPTGDPTKTEEKTAHFFDTKATSNFLISRSGTKITAEVHGRNEEPNTEDLSVIEKIRNFLVAVGGMIAGSKFQWKSFTEGIIEYEK